MIGASARRLCMLLALSAIACSSDEPPKQTAIIVEVNSETLNEPGQLDEVRVVARSTRAGSVRQTATGELSDGGVSFPVSVLLVPANGVMRVEVTAQGWLDGNLVVEQMARTFFVRDQTLYLGLELEAACADVDCPEGETCVATRSDSHECEDNAIDPVDLIPGEGDGDGDGSGGSGDGDGDGSGGSGDGDGDATDGGRDAGGDAGDAGDAGPCVPVDETCNGINDDCDENTDEGDGICPPVDQTYARYECVAGECTFAECVDGGHYHCIGDTGCETARSPTDCGDCEEVCTGGQMCLPDGVGEYHCQDGESCPVSAPNVCMNTCVNINTDAAHCNGCGSRCEQWTNAIPTCEAQECTLSCIAPYQSCDNMDENGCESNRLSDPNNCGGCDNGGERECPARPHATRICDDGSCGFRCLAGYADCTSASGCETSLDTEQNCGECGNSCSGTCCTNTNPPSCSGLLGCLTPQ